MVPLSALPTTPFCAGAVITGPATLITIVMVALPTQTRLRILRRNHHIVGASNWASPSNGAGTGDTIPAGALVKL